MILNEVEGGDENRQFRLGLHPAVTVVSGLSSEQRRELGAAISAAMHGYQVGLKLNVNIFGQEGRLSPQVIAALGFAGLDVDNVMEGGELPGARVTADGQETIHRVLRRLRTGDLAQSAAEVMVSVTTIDPEPEVEPTGPISQPEVDFHSFPAVQMKIRAAAEMSRAVEEAASRVDEATRRASEAAAALEALRASSTNAIDDDDDFDDDQVELPPPPALAEPAIPEFNWDDPYAAQIRDEEAALDEQRSDLVRLRQQVDHERATADNAIGQALADAEAAAVEAEHRVVEAEAALDIARAALSAHQEEANALAEALSVSREAVAALVDRASADVASPNDVQSALKAATQEQTVEPESGPTLGQLADRWAELSNRLEELKSAPKPPAWLVAQVRDDYEEANARVTALRFQKETGIDVKDVLARAEDRLRQATDAWEEMKAGPALEYERADAEARQLYADCVTILGFQPGRKFLAEALRAEQEKQDQGSNTPEKRLRDALAAVGVQATAGEAVSVAQQWLRTNADALAAKTEAQRLLASAEEQAESAGEAAERHRRELLEPAAERVRQIEVDLISARTDVRDATMRLRAMRDRPEEFKAQALEHIRNLENRIEAVTVAIDAASSALSDLQADRDQERQEAERVHEKAVQSLLEAHQRSVAAAQLEYEERNAAALRAAEEIRQEHEALREQRRLEAEQRIKAALTQGEDDLEAANADAEDARSSHAALLQQAQAAEGAIEEAVRAERQRLADEAEAERLAAEELILREEEERKAEEERLRVAAATVEDVQPWWSGGKAADAEAAASLDLSKVDRSDLDFYVLSKGASLRAVGRSESMPLIIDAAFDDLPPLVAQAAFDVLLRICSAVQVIYLSGNDTAERWIDRQPDRIGREARLMFS